MAQALTIVSLSIKITGNPVLQSVVHAFQVKALLAPAHFWRHNPMKRARVKLPPFALLLRPALIVLVAAPQALQAMWTLEISYNPQLASLQGSFPQLQLAGYGALLNITGNTALTSLAGLEVRCMHATHGPTCMSGGWENSGGGQAA